MEQERKKNKDVQLFCRDFYGKIGKAIYDFDLIQSGDNILVGVSGGKDSLALLVTLADQRISVKTVQWMVYKYLKAAGLENRKFSTHKLRHTAATLMYQSGKVDIRVLKDILGHEQLNTTQIYAHISNASMEDAMQNNPLSDVKAPRPIPSVHSEEEED